MTAISLRNYYLKSDESLVMRLKTRWTKSLINPLALELDIYSLAHHLCKM